MGSPDFAVPSLEKLASSRHRILAVISNPDKRRARGGEPVPTEVKKKAKELGLPVIDTKDPGSKEFRDQLAGIAPDLIVIVAFRILPKTILEIPKLGSINLHASLLPKYRGAAPIHWAVINGEKETGCTIFFLDEKVDTGEIINQIKTEIGPNETTGDVYNRLKVIGADLLLQSVEDIASGTYRKLPQNDELATSAPKLFRENTRINFEKNAVEVHNLIRGLHPFPLAWCSYGGEKVNIHKAAPDNSTGLMPGHLEYRDGKLLAGCGSGAIEILKLQMPGKKRMTGTDFANTYDLSVPLL
jgi:methionyl-tRNA formyltransferase